ncbi:MAG: hypothetical protein EBT80_08760 [Chitinophagales bacterium]|nr:hypothetical protein [Chitinophagales bacterium]
MDLTGGNTERAVRSLLSSTTAASNSPIQRNKAFLQLAELSYAAGQYKEASRFYDSLQVKDSSLADMNLIENRKKALRLLVANIDVLQRQDSLWRIALLPEEERKEWARRQLRELKKQQGITDDPAFASSGNNPLQPIVTNTLFTPGDAKGEWYFYNASSRTRGQAEFKNRWGNRPNNDNWRRLAALQAMMNSLMANNTLDSTASGAKQNAPAMDVESFYALLPLSEAQQKRSRDSISASLFMAGKILIQDMEDCSRGVAMLERLLTSDTAFRPKQELYFNLYRCYQKEGDLQKASEMKALLQTQFSDDPITLALFQQKPVGSDLVKKADSVYQQIYELFAAGKYQTAVQQKKIADSLYGAGFWTPQLLYIESIYYIQLRQDSTALRILHQINNQFSSHPLAPKATALIEALANRSRLESSIPPTAQSVQAPANTTAASPTAPGASASPDQGSDFVKDEKALQFAVLVLTNVDLALINETKNALQRFNRENFAVNSLSTSIQPFTEKTRLLQVASFANAEQASLYKERANQKTRTDIAPWLETTQYFWMIISADNWERLNRQKDLEAYKSFLNKNRP